MKERLNMTLRELKKGSYFRIVKASGSISKETYIKDDYCRECRKFYALPCSDVWGGGKLFKSTQEVTTEFEF